MCFRLHTYLPLLQSRSFSFLLMDVPASSFAPIPSLLYAKARRNLFKNRLKSSKTFWYLLENPSAWRQMRVPMCHSSLTLWPSSSRPLRSCPAVQCPPEHATFSHHSHSLLFFAWNAFLFLFSAVYVIPLVTAHLLRSTLGNTVTIKLRITVWSASVLSSVKPALSALQTAPAAETH